MLDFIKEFFENAKERVKSPLIGTFALTWMIFNWKPILVLLFSNWEIESRISYLEKTYTNQLILVIYPLLVTVFYIFALPYINLGIDKVLTHSNSLRKARIVDNKIKSINDEIKIEIAKINLEEAKANFKDRENTNLKVKELESQIQVLNATLSDEKVQHKKEKEEINEENISLKLMITDLNEKITKLHTENNNVNEFVLNHPLPASAFINDNFSKKFEEFSKNTNEIYDNIAKTFEKLKVKSMSPQDFAAYFSNYKNEKKNPSLNDTALKEIIGRDDPKE
jgi:hypothetical protein